ncbi:MAG: prephenate dehydrogenase [Candidatus Krumholzibacteriia bacterium]
MVSTPGRIAVIGLGQIGGSLAAALRAYRDAGCAGDLVVTGCDRDPGLTAEALGRGIIDSGGGNLAACARDAGVVVLAVPVRESIRLIPGIASAMPAGALLLDTGSTKQAVVEAMNRSGCDIRFFGGHPIAGTEKSGPESWDPRLFTGRTFVVTRTARSDGASAEIVEWLLAAVGADVYYMEAAAHDRALAVTSHLPLLVAGGLVASAGHPIPGVEHPGKLAGGSFSSATRVTGKPPAMIADVLTTNRDQLRLAYEAFDREVRELLAIADPAQLASRLSALGEARRRIVTGGRP